MANAATSAAGPLIEKFVAPSGRYLGYAVIGIAFVSSVLDLISDGLGALTFVGFAVAFGLVAWVVLVRPHVSARENGVLMQNMVRDTMIPWSLIKTCRVTQTLQISTRDHLYHGLGVSKSVRQANREDRQKHGGGRQILGPNLGMGGRTMAAQASRAPKHDDDGEPLEVHMAAQEQIAGSYFDHAEQRIAQLSQQRSRSTEGLKPVVAWDWYAVGALVLAVVGVVVAIAH